MLEWTGERFIPGAGSAELAYEHFARYLFAARLADGKDILDIGCGEGYGAFLLARTARRVLGVDLAETAIEHARLRYRRANLEYQAADGARLPEGETFDLITCFEVIEHIPEDEQHALLGQVTRLLSEQGIFLISTPNKPVYREAGGGPDYNNPFHIREMTFTEFRDLLDPYFPAIRWIGQQTLVGNYLNSLPIGGAPAGAEPTPYLGRLVGEELIQGMPATLEETKYFVAVCAKERATLERLAPPGDFMLVDTASAGDREWHATAKWAATLEQRVKSLEEQLRTRLSEAEALQAQIGALRTEGETKVNQHQGQLEAQSRSYQAQIEAQAQQIERLKAEYDAQVLAYRAQFEEQAGVYRTQIEAQAQQIERLKAEYDAQILAHRAQFEEQAGVYRTQIEAQTQQIERLKTEYEAQVRAYRAQSEERAAASRAQIERQTGRIEVYQTQIEGQARQAEVYQVQIQRQVAQIEVYQAQFKEQQDRREAQELQVRELRGEVKRREGQVTQREGELKELRKREAALDAERSWLRDRIRQMQETRFWRLGTLYWRLHSRLFSHAHVAPLPSAREPASSNPVLASPSTPPPPARTSARDDSRNGVRELTVESLPREASVALVNDPSQMRLQLAVRQVIPFPVMADLPGSLLTESGRTAIVQLEVLRARGAEFLLISQAAFPWLKRLAPFKRHLEERYRLAVDGDAYLLFSLREAAAPNLAAPWTQLNQVIDEFQGRYDRDPEILDWSNGLNLARSFPGLVVFSPLIADGVLPYLDETVDIVVIASADTFPEARRVARAVVVTVDSSGATANWKRSESEHGAESVSIIIPCHNGAHHTDNCLAALRETLPHDLKGEIIVVDDASTDETPAVLERWSQREPRLRVLCNEANVGFVASCNRGAQGATGDYIVFLNNDTLPMPGWLSALQRIFREYPDAGAVGGKLILTDGSLQEAGDVIFSDGSAANFGRGDRDLDAALYNYVRAVDYSSGACLATKRALFLELGGFDTRYAPAYYEDVDYAFQLRAHGYRVYYQPECAVIHLEGGTAGTDLSAGVKHYQVINQSKFYEKWRPMLEAQPPRPLHFDFATWQALADREGLAGGATR